MMRMRDEVGVVRECIMFREEMCAFLVNIERRRA